MGSVGFSSLSQCDTGDVLPATTTEVFQPFPSWASAYPGWFWGFTASRTLHSVSCSSGGVSRHCRGKSLLLVFLRGKTGTKPCLPLSVQESAPLCNCWV